MAQLFFIMLPPPPPAVVVEVKLFSVGNFDYAAIRVTSQEREEKTKHTHTKVCGNLGNLLDPACLPTTSTDRMSLS